jgi:penicillin-binding protein 1A
VADEMNSVLTGVVDFGTGTGANIGRPGGTAGKTGTSEEFGDAWFVGYTPELSTSVWMGYADSRKALENIKGTARVYGGTLPAATWKDFMTAALNGVPLSTFPAPGRIIRATPAVPSSPGPAQSGPTPSTTVGPGGPVTTVAPGPGTTLPYVPFDSQPPPVTLDPLAPYVPPPTPSQPFVPQPYTGTGTP